MSNNIENSSNFLGKGKRQIQADKAASKIKSPLIFYDTADGYKINPVYMMDDHPNDERRFAILRSTENGKYVKGGMLYFKINGVELYTEINNVIFVDLNTNVCFIKEYSKVLQEVSPVDPEKRQYIIMMKCQSDTMEEYTWEALEGRTNAYQFIEDNIDEYAIDPDNSFVLTENVPYKDALSVTAFVKYVQNGLVDFDGFDIEDYRTIEENDHQ